MYATAMGGRWYGPFPNKDSAQEWRRSVGRTRGNNGSFMHIRSPMEYEDANRGRIERDLRRMNPRTPTAVTGGRGPTIDLNPITEDIDL